MNELTDQSKRVGGHVAGPLALSTTRMPKMTPQIGGLVVNQYEGLQMPASSNQSDDRLDFRFEIPFFVSNAVFGMGYRLETLANFYNKLNDLNAKVSSPNWDGESANPVNQETFFSAQQFLKSIPYSRITNTHVDASPKGEILVTWESEDEGSSFDVIVGPSGQFSVAGIFRELEIHGPIDRDQLDTLIQTLLDLVSLDDDKTHRR